MLTFVADDPNQAIGKFINILYYCLVSLLLPYIIPLTFIFIEIQMQATSFLIEWINKGEIVSKIGDDKDFGATKKYNSLMHDFEIHFNTLLPTIIANIGNTSITYYK